MSRRPVGDCRVRVARRTRLLACWGCRAAYPPGPAATLVGGRFHLTCPNCGRAGECQALEQEAAGPPWYQWVSGRTVRPVHAAATGEVTGYAWTIPKYLAARWLADAHAAPAVPLAWLRAAAEDRTVVLPLDAVTPDAGDPAA